MNPILLLLAAVPNSAGTEEEIVITASREPVKEADAAASITTMDGTMLGALGLPLASDALRLVPGVSVATSGPPGSQVQLRIRGAEANHSLLFVDGIRFNDPAAGNEAHFELLTTDSLSRLELIRGPQSALWGSEALGGVVAVTSADPRQGNALSARAEYGSHDTGRIAAQGAYVIGDVGISASGGWIRSDGIDATDFDGGDRDGFRNGSASLKAVYSPGDTIEIGLVGHWLDARSAFDGSDPVTFTHVDTLDVSENRILAGRSWLKTDFGTGEEWSLTLDASLLRSRNLNLLVSEPPNTTWGRRTALGAQLTRRLALGMTKHQLTAAVDYQHERFRSRTPDDPTTPFEDESASDQDRTRNLTAFIAEWRADWSSALSSDVTVRHDRFSDFADATTLRASLLFRPAPDWTIHAAYGEGIAQPTFYDLFGFFPDFFIGNPNLKAERGKNWEAGVHWSRGDTSIGITAYRARLRDEIAQVFDPSFFKFTAVNASEPSRRQGFEVEAEHRFSTAFTLRANYSYLDADEPVTTGAGHVREVRRPKHTANLVASVAVGAVRFDTSIAYVGKRSDVTFDEFFNELRVPLHDYVLGSISVGYTLGRGIEAFVRVENAFGADYEEVFSYATPGRTVHAGLRLRLGD